MWHGRLARSAAVAALGAALAGGASTGSARSSPSPAPGGSVVSYVMRGGLGQALSMEAAFPAGADRLLLAGGRAGEQQRPTASLQLLDTATGDDRPAGQAPAPVAEAASAVFAGRDLLLGGIGTAGGACLSSVLALRVGGGRRVTASVSTVAELPEGRAGAGAAVLDGRLFLAGGYGSSPAPGAEGPDLDSVLSSRDGRHFADSASLALGVRYPAVVAFGGSLYVIGGEVVQSGVAEPVAEVQQLEPAAHHAEVVAELPEAVAAPEAWVSGGQLYVAGGDSALGAAGAASVTNDSIWSYDSRRHVFLLVGRLSTPVSHAASAAAGAATALVGGLYQGNPLQSVQLVVAGAALSRTRREPGS